MNARATVTAALSVVASITLASLPSAAVAAKQRPSGAITVSAAASLTEVFEQIGRQFEKRYDGTDVTFNFDASSALVLQIQQGAPVDVLAAADEVSMDELVDGGQVTGRPVVFARNELRIVTKPGNPEDVETLEDLADVGTVALCASSAPCGRYADAALADAGVTIPDDDITRELNAKATLTAVAAGDADAAIVYATDVQAAGSAVQGVAIPDRDNRIARYPIAPLTDAENVTTAKAFAKYVASPAGAAVLRRHGFLVG